MTLTVTVRDNETGDEATQQVPDGDYLLIVTEPAYLGYVQHYANGSALLSVKGRIVDPPGTYGARVVELR